MGSSNHGFQVKHFLSATNAYAGCRVVFAIDIGRRTIGLRGLSHPLIFSVAEMQPRVGGLMRRISYDES